MPLSRPHQRRLSGWALRRALELVDVFRSSGELGHPLVQWVAWNAYGVAVVIWPHSVRWMPGHWEDAGAESFVFPVPATICSQTPQQPPATANRTIQYQSRCAPTKTRHRQRPGPTCSGRSTTRQGSCAAAKLADRVPGSVTSGPVQQLGKKGGAAIISVPAFPEAPRRGTGPSFLRR